MVGALVASGLIGGLALILAELNTQQVVTQKKIETGVEVDALFQRIERTMQDADACRNTMLGGTLAPTPAPPPGLALPTIAPGLNVTIGAIKSRSDRDLVVTGNTYGNRLVSVTSQTLKVNANPLPTGGGDTQGTLEVVMTRESRAYTGQKTVTRRVPLVLRVDGSNNLTSCQFDETALADAILKRICEDIAKWPPAASPTPPPPSPWDPATRRCNLGICSGNEIMKGFDSTGKACRLAIPDMACATGEVVLGIKVDYSSGNVTLVCGPARGSSCAILTPAQIQAAPGMSAYDSATDLRSTADNTCKIQTDFSSNRCSTTNNFTSYRPMGCCYRGGVVTAAGGSECAATYIVDGEDRALSMRYCEDMCPAQPPPEAIKLNCQNCNDANLSVGAGEFAAWACDPQQGSRYPNCLIPEYKPREGSTDECSLVMSIGDVNDSGGNLVPSTDMPASMPPSTCKP